MWCPASEAAQLQGRGNPAGVLQGALEHGHQGAGSEAFTPQPERQADGGHGVGQRGERRPRHYEHPGYALHGAAAGQVHEAAGHVHPGVEQAEPEEQPGNRQGGQDRRPQPGPGDRTEEDHMGVGGGQPHGWQIEQDGRANARAVEEDAVDDPRRYEHDGESNAGAQRRGSKGHALGAAGSPSTVKSSSRLSPGPTFWVARPSWAYAQSPEAGLTQKAQ
jgi:hypothetical protein